MEDNAQRAARVLRAMAERRWSQADLATAAQIDPGTLSDFLSGERKPRGKTLAKIDAALGLTPGTLAASAPEDPTPTYGITLAEATDAELLAELTYRVEALRRTVDSLKFGQMPHTGPTGESDGVVNGSEGDRAVADPGAVRVDDAAAHHEVGGDLRPHGKAGSRQ